MITLYMTRHGETLENATGILQGHLAGHLSLDGIEQAQDLGDELADIPFDSIVSSPLRRALITAEIVNRYHNLCIHTTDLLRERDWGSFTGVKVGDIQQGNTMLPGDVESLEHLHQRAVKYLDYLLENFDGQTVLSVGHGYFNRCILAAYYGVTPREIPRWANTEVRVIQLDYPISWSEQADDSEADDEASAD